MSDVPRYSVIGMYLFVVAALVVCLLIECHERAEENVKADTVFVDKWDTVTIEKHDTLPVEREKKVVQYITLPCPEKGDTAKENNSTADITLEVVQKEYSDDSTYTAYVSGIQHNDLPKLDSIIVRERRITNTIRETITLTKKRSRWSVGFQAGYGLGLQSRTLEPYVGVGVGYALFPP